MLPQKIIKSSQKFRSKYLEPAGKFLLKLKLTANHLTFFSFLFGLLAAYFLFQNHTLFIIFIILHLLIDGLDGVLARLTKPTLFGNYFDHLTDQVIAFLLLLRIYFYLNDYYVIIVLSLFVLTYLIYFLSKMTYPAIFVRTGTAIALIFTPLFPNLIPNGTYLIVGVFILYSLLLQLRYFIKTRTYSS